MPIGLFLLLIVYCTMILKSNRIKWFERGFFWRYNKKPVAHWEKRSNRVRWLISTTFLLLLSIFGLLNFGLYRLTDPYTLIFIRESSNYRVNQHLFFNLVIFGFILFIVFLTVLPLETIHSKTIPTYLLAFGIIYLSIFWIPNIMNHLWYLNEYINLSILKIIPLPDPLPQNLGNETETVVGPPFMVGNTDVFNFILLIYLNLILSTVLSYLIIIMIFGSIKNSKRLGQGHNARKLQERITCLNKIKEVFEHETVGTWLSLEEIMVSCRLSRDETDWILNYFNIKYPGSWFSNINLFKITPKVLNQLNQLINELSDLKGR